MSLICQPKSEDMKLYIIISDTKFRRDQEEGGELDSHEEIRLSFAGPGEIKRREVELGSES